jgi:hypothetical protein
MSALLHATNFNLRVWPLAIGRQIYALLLGVLYGVLAGKITEHR